MGGRHRTRAPLRRPRAAARAAGARAPARRPARRPAVPQADRRDVDRDRPGQPHRFPPGGCVSFRIVRARRRRRDEPSGSPTSAPASPRPDARAASRPSRSRSRRRPASRPAIATTSGQGMRTPRSRSAPRRSSSSHPRSSPSVKVAASNEAPPRRQRSKRTEVSVAPRGSSPRRAGNRRSSPARASRAETAQVEPDRGRHVAELRLGNASPVARSPVASTPLAEPRRRRFDQLPRSTATSSVAARARLPRRTRRPRAAPRRAVALRRRTGLRSPSPRPALAQAATAWSPTARSGRARPHVRDGGASANSTKRRTPPLSVTVVRGLIVQSRSATRPSTTVELGAHSPRSRCARRPRRRPRATRPAGARSERPEALRSAFRATSAKTTPASGLPQGRPSLRHLNAVRTRLARVEQQMVDPSSFQHVARGLCFRRRCRSP